MNIKSAVSLDKSTKSGFNNTNKAISDSFKHFMRANFTISPPSDIYEQEADVGAEKVMRMPDSKAEPLFFRPKPLSLTPVQRKCADCESEEKLQHKENDEQVPIQLMPSKDLDVQRKYIHSEEEEKIQLNEATIQRQSKDEESPPPPVLQPMIEWDDGREINLSLPSDFKLSEDGLAGSTSDPLASGGSVRALPNFREARLRLVGKGVLTPGEYTDDIGNLWQDRHRLVLDWKLGNVAKNALDKIPSWLHPDLEGQDIDTYITNKLVLETIGSSNSKDQPELTEGSGFTIPLYSKKWRF